MVFNKLLLLLFPGTDTRAARYASSAKGRIMAVCATCGFPTLLFMSPSHTSVISARYPTGQPRVGAFGSSGTELHANVAVGLCLNSDSHILFASAATDHSSDSVFGSNSDTLILRRADSRAPRAIECAGSGHVGRHRLVDRTAGWQREHHSRKQHRPDQIKILRSGFKDGNYLSFLSRHLSPRKSSGLYCHANLPRRV